MIIWEQGVRSVLSGLHILYYSLLRRNRDTHFLWVLLSLPRHDRLCETPTLSNQLTVLNTVELQLVKYSVYLCVIFGQSHSMILLFSMPREVIYWLFSFLHTVRHPRREEAESIAFWIVSVDKHTLLHLYLGKIRKGSSRLSYQ